MLFNGGGRSYTRVAQQDSVWGVALTSKDEVVSVSADGTIKKRNAVSGQVSLAQPPHTLGLVSLDIDPTGKYALYNTLEGLTSLLDMDKGEVVGKYESYARSGTEASEPGKSRLYIDSSWALPSGLRIY